MAARKKQPTDEQAPVKPARKKRPAVATRLLPANAGRLPADQRCRRRPGHRRRGPGTFRPDKPDLVIVESPTKAKTINKYLGPNYIVRASYGHVRDLPKRRRKGEVVAGIDIDNGWVPTYVVRTRTTARASGKAKAQRSNGGRPKEILAELKREAAKCNRVYLATDPDREGEAIAWHIKEALGLDDDRTCRVTFNEITERRCRQAFANPGKIDMDRVQAQEARRILDRVVGYPLSNLLEQEDHREPERRPGPVGRRAPGRRSRARDPGVQARGILEDHRPAGSRRPHPLRGDGQRPRGETGSR